MDAVIAVFALLIVLLFGLGAYATVKAVGAAKRGVDRGITQARRTVEDHTLRAKSFAQPGAAGELAQLRLKLRTSMRTTQEALHAAVAEDESLKESVGLFERLSAHGHELDDELKRLESEPDRAALTERLPGLRERTERITHSADSLRWAARDRARRFADDDLDSLSAQIDLESGALRHWTAPEPQPASSEQPSSSAQSATARQQPSSSAQSGSARQQAAPSQSGPPPWPEAPAADAATAGQTWPDTAQSSSAQEPVRPAITPPAARPTYPWQKKPRPESTT
ncbi:hypothetical protein RFN57_16615 [Streptomyces violaceochromogenes]|uniref:Secreted protein n=1 Tax=Streptomyces violaceochromogenes TaxID=67377 RepID=A0ABU6LXM2_9ACTN|nr:hypothetical protein [Streptomyces violaceochromogenes]MEC7053903.1 hypothetical protein [Streptomyces violaceochromogenes]GHC61776.1 hypothetical protein GCM10010309_23380 [Streptomyces violaceochromogenes]